VGCKKEQDELAHRYQRKWTSPFRIRCGFRGCNSKLERSANIQWFVSLLDGDKLGGDRLVQRLRRALEEEEESNEEEPKDLDEEGPEKMVSPLAWLR
jgi:hypothetical protein